MLEYTTTVNASGITGIHISHPVGGSRRLDPREILSHPTPRPAYTGAAHLLVRVVNQETVDTANPATKEIISILKAAPAEGCDI